MHLMHLAHLFLRVSKSPDSVTSIGEEAFCDCDSLASVVFKNISGWYVSSGKGIDVSNSATAATYLRSTYRDNYWYRS